MKTFTDLHVHTHKSDGSDSIEEVLTLARDNNVSVLSITDHNTLKAYTQETFEEAKRLEIKLVPGVELDVIYKNRQYHLLAYGIDVQNEKLQEVCAYNSKVQEAYNLSLMQCMERDGMGISKEEYLNYEIPRSRGGWKLLNYLLDKGITESLLEGTKFYKQYGFNSNDIKFIGLEEAVQVVKKSSGIPILAHPAEQIPYNQYDTCHEKFWSQIEQLLKTGIEGVECIHPLHGFGLQKDLIAMCKMKGLYVSGGTDYHGHFFNKQKQTIGGQLINTEIVSQLLDCVIRK